MIFEMEEHRFRAAVTREFFISPADRNYTYARFFRGMGDPVESWWQALQAIEKYIKAGLVLNGTSLLRPNKVSKENPDPFGHDILLLKREHDRVFGEQAVIDLCKPKKLRDELWAEDPLNAILQKINDIGSPDGRYGLNNYFNAGFDIFVFDALVFELRRRTVCLDWRIGEHWELSEDNDEMAGLQFRQVIDQFPQYQPRRINSHKGKYDSKGVFDSMGASMDDARHNWNFQFVRDEGDLDKECPSSFSAIFGGFGNSMLLSIYRATNAISLDNIENAIVGLKWIIDNIRVPRDARDAYQFRIKELEHAMNSGDIYKLSTV